MRFKNPHQRIILYSWLGLSLLLYSIVIDSLLLGTIALVWHCEFHWLRPSMISVPKSMLDTFPI